MSFIYQKDKYLLRLSTQGVERLGVQGQHIWDQAGLHDLVSEKYILWNNHDPYEGM